MKLSTNDFRGTDKVFRFTLKQMMCNKANIISLAVVFLLLLCMMPVMTLINGRNTSYAITDIDSFTDYDSMVDYTEGEFIMPEKIFVLNETPFELDLASDLFYANTEIEAATFSADAYNESLADNEAFLHIYIDENGLAVDCAPAEFDEIGYRAADILTEEIQQATDSAEILQTPYYTTTYNALEYEEDSDFEMSMDSYGVQLIYSIVVMLVSTYAVSFIVQSVVEEKTSKLVETLMISVKPLALILGKILAAMLYVFGIVLLNIIAAVMSFLINKALFGEAADSAMLDEMGFSLADLNITPLTVVVILVSLFLGYFTYSLIAGMSGAGCSQAEEIQSANSASMMIIMACYLIALVTTMMQSQAVSVITSVVPFISIFCAPVQYMMGNIGLGVLIGSWVLQIAVIAFLAWMCAKIYADLIIYNGSRLTFFNIIKMAFAKKNREV